MSHRHRSKTPYSRFNDNGGPSLVTTFVARGKEGIEDIILTFKELNAELSKFINLKRQIDGSKGPIPQTPKIPPPPPRIVRGYKVAPNEYDSPIDSEESDPEKEFQKLKQMDFSNKYDRKVMQEQIGDLSEYKEGWDKVTSSMTKVSFMTFLLQNSLKSLGLESKLSVKIFNALTSTMQVTTTVMTILTMIIDLQTMSRKWALGEQKKKLMWDGLEIAATRQKVGAKTAEVAAETALSPISLPFRVAASIAAVVGVGTAIMMAYGYRKKFHSGGTVQSDGQYKLEKGEVVKNRIESQFDGPSQSLVIQNQYINTFDSNLVRITNQALYDKMRGL